MRPAQHLLVAPRGTQIVGYRDAFDGDGTAPDAGTVFEGGSTAKTFTSLMLAREVVEGRLTLDPSVQSPLPEGVRAPTGARPITLKDLAVHGAGLLRLAGQRAFRLTPSGETDFFLRDVVARMHSETDASGAWSRLRLDQNGRTTRATR